MEGSDMDKFTETLTEGLRRFAMASVGAVSLTVEKSKEIIDQLAERGEATAAEGRVACDELQKKMSAQIEAFTKKLKADYEAASFEQLMERCAALPAEQKARLIERLTAPTEPEAPVDPVDPIDIIDPVDPVDPIDPIDPVDPVDPIDTETPPEA